MVLSRIYTGFFSSYRFTQDLISACPGFTQKSTELDPSKQRKTNASVEAEKNQNRFIAVDQIDVSKQKKSIAPSKLEIIGLRLQIQRSILESWAPGDFSCLQNKTPQKISQVPCPLNCLPQHRNLGLPESSRIPYAGFFAAATATRASNCASAAFDVIQIFYKASMQIDCQHSSLVTSC